MPNIPQIKIGNTIYKVKDELARQILDNMSETVGSLFTSETFTTNGFKTVQFPVIAGVTYVFTNISPDNGSISNIYGKTDSTTHMLHQAAVTAGNSVEFTPTYSDETLYVYMDSNGNGARKFTICAKNGLYEDNIKEAIAVRVGSPINGEQHFDQYARNYGGQLTIENNTSVFYIKLNVQGGVTYEVTAPVNNLIPSVVLADSNGVVLRSVMGTGANPDIVSITPEQNCYMYVNAFYRTMTGFDPFVKACDFIPESIIDEYLYGYCDFNYKWISQKFTRINAGTGQVDIISNTYTMYAEIEASAGDAFEIYTGTNSQVADFIFANSNNQPVYWIIGADSTMRTYHFAAPVNGTLYVNAFEGNGATVKKRMPLKASILVGEIEELSKKVNSDDKTILILGDSQTQRTGYPERLINDLTDNHKVYRYGHGGAGSVDVAHLYGSIPIYIEPLTIPATTDAVEITLRTDSEGLLGDGTAWGVQSVMGINPCYIAGVRGTISMTHDPDYSNKHYYFTRAYAGDAVTTTRPVMLQTYASTIENSVLVIWVGTNDSYNKTDVQKLFEDVGRSIDTMIEKNGSNKYIVMGLTAKAYMTDYAQVNKLMAWKYGLHFLDLGTYLINYGLQDAGLTPTSGDQTDIANGEMPRSLRADAVHFNSTGYTVIGDLLYKKGIELGYWE